jgi:hypothetical protein
MIMIVMPFTIVRGGSMSCMPTLVNTSSLGNLFFRSGAFKLSLA